MAKEIKDSESQSESESSEDEIGVLLNKSKTWDKTLFVNQELIEQFCCVVCKNIPKNPFVIENENKLFCEIHSTKNSKLILFIKSQIENQEIICPNILNNNSNNNEFNEGGNPLIINTNNNFNCKWKGKLKDVNIHLNKCEYIPNKITVNSNNKNIKKLKNKYKILKNENKNIKNELNEFKFQINELSTIVNSLQKELQSMKNNKLRAAIKSDNLWDNDDNDSRKKPKKKRKERRNKKGKKRDSDSND